MLNSELEDSRCLLDLIITVQKISVIWLVERSAIKLLILHVTKEK